MKRGKRSRQEPIKRLFVGEGMFHYALSILKKHPETAKSIIATEKQTEEELSKHPTFITNKNLLEQNGVTMLLNVDAKKLHENKDIKGNMDKHRRIERIHWNFPHDRSDWSTTTSMRDMIADFFKSSKKIQEKGDKIYITLPRKYSSNTFMQGYVYGIGDASLNAGYTNIDQREFNPKRYKNYKHNITGSNQSLDIAKYGVEFVFKKVAETETEIKNLKTSSNLKIDEFDQKKTGRKIRYSSWETRKPTSLEEYDGSASLTEYSKNITTDKEYMTVIKNKSTVVNEVSKAIDAGDIIKIAKALEKVTKNINHYWDIDGGFEAMSQIGNHFSNKHAEYFKERITKDYKWRLGPGLKAINSLAERIDHIQPIKAVINLTSSLFKEKIIKIETIVSIFKKIKINLIDERARIITKACLKLCKEKLLTKKPSKDSSIIDVIEGFKAKCMHIISIFYIASFIKPKNKDKTIYSSDDIKDVFKDNYAYASSIFSSINFQEIVSSKAEIIEKSSLYEDIFHSDENDSEIISGLKDYLGKEHKEELQRCIIKSLKNRNEVLKTVKLLLSNKIVTEAEIAKYLITAMKNPDHPVFWVVDGGFEAMSELGNHFSKEHADYIYESVTKNVDFKLPHAIFAIEESLLAKNLNDETKEIVITLLNKLRQYDKEDLFNKYPNISRLLSESGDDVITDLNFNKASIG